MCGTLNFIHTHTTKGKKKDATLDACLATSTEPLEGPFLLSHFNNYFNVVSY